MFTATGSGQRAVARGVVMTAGMSALAAAVSGGREQSRARYPDDEGYVERGGERLFYEVYGGGAETIFLLPTWSLLHARHWKFQIPYLARHFRVVAMDGLGNGRSGRCRETARYEVAEFARDCLAVLDVTATERAAMVGLSRGGQYLLELARMAPERVAGAAFISPRFPYTAIPQASEADQPLGHRSLGVERHPWWRHEDWGARQREYAAFAEWFVGRCLPEPHSTKGIEDGVRWALDTDADTMAATIDAAVHRDRETLSQLARGLPGPVLVIQGALDIVNPPRDAVALAELTSGQLRTFPDAGHFAHLRKPVATNLALRDFAEDAFGRRRDPVAHRPDGRKHVLFVCSPIGLGHAQRDVAIARELRRLVPGLQVHWLAQDPVTRVLEVEGEHIHPASAHLASESTHIESESAEHDLHCFQAIRRMDDILLANFMVFHDLARDDRYDLWVGDEAWELDYYLHENPRQKTTPFAWLTDFVGFLPMPDGGEREAFLTADHNADMVDHVSGHPEVRDLALFVGNPDDIVDDRLGPQLPTIRNWTEQHFEFTGYVTGFNPAEFSDRDRLRHELGYQDNERICIVAVGGSGVGADLLRRVIAAFKACREAVPDLRMIVIAGPRIDPAGLPAHDGLEVVGYVHNLYRHLAACDLAVVQGGLTTAMELTAHKRPFLYFPLRHHFEQQFHVRHRLERYRAGRCMTYDAASPETIADAIAAEIDRTIEYRDVEVDGAARAARRLVELL